MIFLLYVSHFLWVDLDSLVLDIAADMAAVVCSNALTLLAKNQALLVVDVCKLWDTSIADTVWEMWPARV